MTIAVVKRRFLDKRIQRSVFRILRDSALCSMSTVAPGNRAHINTAYFCYSPDLNFYFLSDPDQLPPASAAQLEAAPAPPVQYQCSPNGNDPQTATRAQSPRPNEDPDRGKAETSHQIGVTRMQRPWRRQQIGRLIAGRGSPR